MLNGGNQGISIYLYYIHEYRYAIGINNPISINTCVIFLTIWIYSNDNLIKQQILIHLAVKWTLLYKIWFKKSRKRLIKVHIGPATVNWMRLARARCLRAHQSYPYGFHFNAMSSASRGRTVMPLSSIYCYTLPSYSRMFSHVISSRTRFRVTVTWIHYLYRLMKWIFIWKTCASF